MISNGSSFWHLSIHNNLKSSLPNWPALATKHLIEIDKNIISCWYRHVLMLQRIIQRPKYDTLGLLIHPLPIMIIVSLVLSYPLWLLWIEFYVQISFPIHIVWSDQLISTKNVINWIIRHDICNRNKTSYYLIKHTQQVGN